ncbi:hypothetical protein V2J09_012607 [Rumex salicifolius]
MDMLHELQIRLVLQTIANYRLEFCQAAPACSEIGEVERQIQQFEAKQSKGVQSRNCLKNRAKKEESSVFCLHFASIQQGAISISSRRCRHRVCLHIPSPLTSRKIGEFFTYTINTFSLPHRTPMTRKNFTREDVPLSRLGVLVAQLESIVASAAQQHPDPLLCFDLLSDLISAIEDGPKDSIILSQRKCEDALYSLLTLGARRPVRHLASVAMARIILKGDPISIYSRVSSLQGFLSDGKRVEPQRVAGAAQCLGELYHFFGRRITSGLLETTSIATKLMKSNEEYVRKEALSMLQKALEGSGGTAASAAYTEGFRLVMRFGVGDKSFIVRVAAARCLKAFANVGGPGLGTAEFENSASYCALDDPNSAVRDAFAEALGVLLALWMNPEEQVHSRGNSQATPAKKMEGCLQKYLAHPFTKATGSRLMLLRVGLTLSWVCFLQATRLKYLHPDIDLQDYSIQVMDMLRLETSVDAQALACVLYILRVGVTDQMTEPTQRSFLVVLAKQLQSCDASPAMKVAALRTLSYTLKTLGEVPYEFKEVLDDTVVAALSHSSELVRVEAALTLQALAEVDPTCVGGLVSYGVTTLSALRENLAFEKGSNLKLELDSFHGQATVLSALVSISPKLLLGYPAKLPKSVLEVSKKMLTESSRNPSAVTIEKEAGWLLLSALLASMPKEELEEQVFDILTLWAPLFSGNADVELARSEDLTSKLCVWSSSIDALTAFVRCFISPQAMKSGILLQPVLMYLSSALSYVTALTIKELPNIKRARDIFVIRTLIAFQSLPDPNSYANDHSRIIQLCTAPFRNPSGYEESSCLRLLLDKRDSWLGPWIPGRDWFEDELRAFQGGKDGLVPCVWDSEHPSFPQPETVSKMLVNQMLLSFGSMFAFQDSSGIRSLLGIIEQCLKAGRRQLWHSKSVTNICVGLLAGLKALLIFHPQPLGVDILYVLQTIFQGILAEGDICASQRRAASEGLGFISRLGNDLFTARMTKSLLSELAVTIDSGYAGAGGMALSSLVPATVSGISSLAKSSVASVQIWPLHGLLLTIEAAGLSYISHVQGTLSLALETLLVEENGWFELHQGLGRLINAIVAVIGPELSPGSIFFSRCKSVISEISSCQETATLLESARFTQQLAIFAPQATTVHSHMQTLLPTLCSRQPTLRYLAISTLQHLVEKDPVSVAHEQIEDNLFYMLDEETDIEIGNLVRSTIIRLLYASCPTCPSHWISVCRKMVLSVSTSEFRSSDPHPTDGQLDHEEDDDSMVSSSKSASKQGYPLDSTGPKRDKHLRYRTKVFAAECLSHLPTAVGNGAAHFDLCLARSLSGKAHPSSDWLVLHLHDLLSLAYQVSTIQFENMQPVGVGLLSTIIDKFGRLPDPELPDRLLLEQYQAQLLSALRSALDASAGPILLEAGLQLATKILTSGIIRGDQGAARRIFSLISRPLDDFKELYYPSFAEWVSCKIKVRLLAAHATLKCHTYTFLGRHPSEVPQESMALLPLFSKSSNLLGKLWVWTLKDHCHICFKLHSRENWKPFLDEIQSPMVYGKLKSCLEEAWPVILQALVLDAIPVNVVGKSSVRTEEKTLEKEFISGYSMVELDTEDFHFIWGLALFTLFQGNRPTFDKKIMQVGTVEVKRGELTVENANPPNLKMHEAVLPVFQFLCTRRFFVAGFVTADICRELLQVLTYVGCKGESWDSLVVAILSQVVKHCPEDFLDMEDLGDLAMEISLAYLFRIHQSAYAATPDQSSSSSDDIISQLFITLRTLLDRFGHKKGLKHMLAFMLITYQCIRGTSSEANFSKINEFVQSTDMLLRRLVEDESNLDDSTMLQLQTIITASENATKDLTTECVEAIHLLENKKSNLRRLMNTKLAFCLEQTLNFASLAYKIIVLQRKSVDSISMATFADCVKCFDRVLMDESIQVQAIGLQVLKNTLQKRAAVKGDSSVVILMGELFGCTIMVIQKILEKPVTRESAALAGECLRTLMLMQALPMGIECQKILLSLLLEAIVMVLSITEDDVSLEIREIRSVAIKLVSHLVQIPSAAVHLKDVLLDMSATHRQQIQSVIRASVTQDNDKASVIHGLEIKVPLPSEISKTQNEPATLPPLNESDDGDDDNDDDDWDAFQSFPASTDATVTDGKLESSQEQQSSIEVCSVSDLDSQHDNFSSSLTHSSTEETLMKDPSVASMEGSLDEDLINQSDAKSRGFEPEGSTSYLSGNQILEDNESGQEAGANNELTVSDQQPSMEVIGSTEGDVLADNVTKEEGQINPNDSEDAMPVGTNQGSMQSSTSQLKEIPDMENHDLSPKEVKGDEIEQEDHLNAHEDHGEKIKVENKNSQNESDLDCDGLSNEQGSHPDPKEPEENSSTEYSTSDHHTKTDETVNLPQLQDDSTTTDQLEETPTNTSDKISGQGERSDQKEGIH